MVNRVFGVKIMKKPLITHAELIELLDYRDGKFYYKTLNPRDRSNKIGDEAGCAQYYPKRNEYRWKIAINGRQYNRSRLVWLYFTSQHPQFTIDHKITKNTLDDRFENLRDIPNGKNVLNRGLSKANTSNFKGVSLKKGRIKKPWVAQIRFDGKTENLGYYATKEEAHQRYCKRALELHGEYANFG